MGHRLQPLPLCSLPQLQHKALREPVAPAKGDQDPRPGEGQLLQRRRNGIIIRAVYGIDRRCYRHPGHQRLHGHERRQRDLLQAGLRLGLGRFCILL